MATEANSPAGAASRVTMTDDERLAQLGYAPQLTRVLGLFSNFSVAFTYLSPMVGIYSLFALGLGMAGPSYIWLTLIPVVGMLFVALVFGELASHYPVAGALYNYGKFSVGAGYGWFVGWFYGVALLVTVASVDTGVVQYFAALTHNWFGWNLNPAAHGTILWVTLALVAIQTFLNITGTAVMATVARYGVYVELVGTFGIAIVLGINGFHHGLGYLFSSQGATHLKTNAYGFNFHGNWLTGAALVAVLAPVYIFYGFESAGDIAEETRDASRMIPRAMRLALIWGGIASLILTGGLLLAIPATHGAIATTVTGGVASILAQLPQWLQDIALLLIIYAFFSCGTSVQGAGSRLAFSYARDGALPASRWIAKVSDRHRIPVNALLGGAGVTVLFMLLVFVSPKHNVSILWFTYPANTSALVSLVSFGVSGIYLSFLMTVVGSMIARARGWIPEGAFRLGRWGWTVSIIAAVYLALMFINVVLPSGLTSARSYFNIDWITLMVMVLIALVGGVYYVIGRPDRVLRQHLHDELEPSAAERIGSASAYR
ncbi:MAG TPA: APC family permease [Solirubrobacteraceae bacterium]|nr:APC family permease [Solirubrobacteraceae bacterium]